MTKELWAVWREIVVFDFEIVTKLFHHFVIQIGPIVSDEFTRQTIMTNQFLFDKFDHNIPGHTGI